MDTPELPKPIGRWMPTWMARAMRLAVESGRYAHLAGRIPRRYRAEASSSYDGMLEGMIAAPHPA